MPELRETSRKETASDNASALSVIEPRRARALVDWAELRRYRDLFMFLVARNIKVLYKQTVLGFAWAVLRPLISMLIFTVIFGRLVHMRSDGLPYAVFNFAALVPWTYFATALAQSTESLVANTDLLTKVYFPRLLIPLTPIAAGLVDFAVALVLLVVLSLLHGVHFAWSAVYAPLPLALLLMTVTGMGLWTSAMGVQYRDIRHAVPFLMQLLLYAAPVVWPASLIDENFPDAAQWIRPVYGLYPMAGVVEGFRAALFGATPMPWDLIGVGFCVAALLCVTGARYFRRMERVLADVA